MPRDYESDAERRRREAEQRERDAQREAERTDWGTGLIDPGTPYAAEQWQQDSAGTPIWGWLSGADAAVDRAANEQDRARALGMWGGLSRDMPTADELTPDYYYQGTEDIYGDLLGDPSQMNQRLEGAGAQREALRNLANITQSGGYTQADQAWAAAQRAQEAQALRGQNEAALPQMQARGMGGSGAELAMRLAGSQQMSANNALASAQTQQMALQRMMQATQMQGSIGGQMDANELARRNALDAFNQANLGWRRGREAANVGIANQQQDRITGARQQAYENRERQVAGATNQYNSNQSNRSSDAARQDEANAAATASLGSLIEGLL